MIWLALIATLAPGPNAGETLAPAETALAPGPAPAPAPTETAPPETAPPETAPPAPGSTPPGSTPPGSTPPGSTPPETLAETPPETPAEPPEEITPAPLPSAAPAAPSSGEPRAIGGAYDTPLPRAPSSEDPSTITAGPWRGRAWLGFGLLASIPVGGRAPAAGGVVAVVGELTVGWRLRPFVALHTSISSFAHDAGQRTVATVDGPVTELVTGRITAFDLVTARFFLPVPGRIQPWAEAGLGVGIRRGPFALERQAAGLARLGLGVDFWLAHSLTLGISTAYRTTMIQDTVGHGLRAGADLGIHW